MHCHMASLHMAFLCPNLTTTNSSSFLPPFRPFNYFSAAKRTLYSRNPCFSVSVKCDGTLPGHGGEKKKVVVVGGGWAGLGSAHQLVKAGVDVTLLDASSYAGGLSGGFRTEGGKAVEAGIKGFWWQYHNINALVSELNLPQPFTEWTRSSFYSPYGLDVEAPVFHELPRLPTPLGSFLYTLPLFRRLPLVDRLTAMPLLQALIEFDVDEEAYTYYDEMSARELFRRAGVSSRLYKEFLEPILLVTLFAPGEKLSAAAALGALYYYVLAHQSDFDVRWCKGSVGELIFHPWIKALTEGGGKIRGRRRVEKVEGDGETRSVNKVIAVNSDGEREEYLADAVIFAVGVQAMQKIVAGSPALSSRTDFNAFSNLGGIDVLAVRLWLDRKISLPNPSNVLAGFEPTSGATLFDLTALQDEYRYEVGSVFEVDVYHANQLLALSDDEIISAIRDRYLAKCHPSFEDAKIIDRSVLRFRGAVTLFGTGTHQHMPSTETSVRNVFMAGDWLKQGPGSHGARGLSQEKAYVTGLEAANSVSDYLKLLSPRARVVAVEVDEPHIGFAKSLARETREVLRKSGLRSPLL